MSQGQISRVGAREFNHFLQRGRVAVHSAVSVGGRRGTELGVYPGANLRCGTSFCARLPGHVDHLWEQDNRLEPYLSNIDYVLGQYV